jgi:hypothetical protein
MTGYLEHIKPLYNEYKTRDIFHSQTAIKETPGGTKEFAFYDLFRIGLIFY